MRAHRPFLLRFVGLAAVLLGIVPLAHVGRGAPAPDPKLVTVGFVYVGPKDDAGYSQCHAAAVAALGKLKGVRCVEKENQPEDDGATEVMEAMIAKDGAKVIFATSFGYLRPFVAELARKHPDVRFLHPSGPWKQGEFADNVITFHGVADEARYLSGIVAGSTTRSNKLGFVAAKPIPHVRREINAFCLGARSVNPKAEVIVLFTGDWTNAEKEAAATKAVSERGADVVTCLVDSPKVVIQTAERAGILSCGYHVNQQSLAPKGYLTGAEWNWDKLYVEWVQQLQKGEKLVTGRTGGLKAGFVRMSPYGPSVTAQVKKAADTAKAKILDGTLVIFKGPLKDDAGKEVIATGIQLELDDPKLNAMDYFVEGVVGSAK
jgi:simple sugar transport system substrate-binding protein